MQCITKNHVISGEENNHSSGLILLGSHTFKVQKKPDVYCSQGMHNIQVKTNIFFVQISESVLKMDLFWFIYGSVFIDKLFVYSNFSQRKIVFPYLTCICDFVCILAMRYCISIMASVYTL